MKSEEEKNPLIQKKPNEKQNYPKMISKLDDLPFTKWHLYIIMSLGIYSK